MCKTLRQKGNLLIWSKISFCNNIFPMLSATHVSEGICIMERVKLTHHSYFLLNLQLMSGEITVRKEDISYIDTFFVLYNIYCDIYSSKY